MDDQEVYEVEHYRSSPPDYGNEMAEGHEYYEDLAEGGIGEDLGEEAMGEDMEVVDQGEQLQDTSHFNAEDEYEHAHTDNLLMGAGNGEEDFPSDLQQQQIYWTTHGQGTQGIISADDQLQILQQQHAQLQEQLMQQEMMGYGEEAEYDSEEEVEEPAQPELVNQSHKGFNTVQDIMQNEDEAATGEMKIQDLGSDTMGDRQSDQFEIERPGGPPATQFEGTQQALRANRAKDIVRIQESNSRKVIKPSDPLGDQEENDEDVVSMRTQLILEKKEEAKQTILKNSVNELNNKAKSFTQVTVLGSNAVGQLGFKKAEDADPDEPENFITKPKGLNFNIGIKQIACGAEHTMLLTTEGAIYTMGSNKHGQLGLSFPEDILPEVKLPTLVQGMKGKKIASGWYHSIVLDDKGFCHGWGYSLDGAIGMRITSPHEPAVIQYSSQYAHVTIKDVSCGAYHTVFLSRKGEAFACGRGDKGQLGIGFLTIKEYRPIVIRLRGYVEEKIRHIACGSYHTCFLTTTGKIFSTGLNDEGQLGLDNNNHNVSWPEIIESVDHINFKQISCGRYSSALDAMGNYYAWGSFNGKCLAYPQCPDSVQTQFTKIRQSSSVSAAVDIEGKLWAWTNYTQEELKDPAKANELNPLQLPFFPILFEPMKYKHIAQVEVGDNFIVGLSEEQPGGRRKVKHQANRQSASIRSRSTNLRKDNAVGQKHSLQSQGGGILANYQTRLVPSSPKKIKDFSKTRQSISSRVLRTSQQTFLKSRTGTFKNLKQSSMADAMRSLHKEKQQQQAVEEANKPGELKQKKIKKQPPRKPVANPGLQVLLNTQLMNNQENLEYLANVPINFDDSHKSQNAQKVLLMKLQTQNRLLLQETSRLRAQVHDQRKSSELYQMKLKEAKKDLMSKHRQFKQTLEAKDKEHAELNQKYHALLHMHDRMSKDFDRKVLRVGQLEDEVKQYELAAIQSRAQPSTLRQGDSILKSMPRGDTKTAGSGLNGTQEVSQAQYSGGEASKSKPSRNLNYSSNNGSFLRKKSHSRESYRERIDPPPIPSIGAPISQSIQHSHYQLPSDQKQGARGAWLDGLNNDINLTLTYSPSHKSQKKGNYSTIGNNAGANHRSSGRFSRQSSQPNSQYSKVNGANVGRPANYESEVVSLQKKSRERTSPLRKSKSKGKRTDRFSKDHKQLNVFTPVSDLSSPYNVINLKIYNKRGSGGSIAKKELEPRVHSMI